MSDQGAAPHQRPEDGWWHSVYAGPADTLPDTPEADPGNATIDDWFASAAGLIAPQRTAATTDRAATTERAATTHRVATTEHATGAAEAVCVEAAPAPEPGANAIPPQTPPAAHRPPHTGWAAFAPATTPPAAEPAPTAPAVADLHPPTTGSAVPGGGAQPGGEAQPGPVVDNPADVGGAAHIADAVVPGGHGSASDTAASTQGSALDAGEDVPDQDRSAVGRAAPAAGGALPGQGAPPGWDAGDSTGPHAATLVPGADRSASDSSVAVGSPAVGGGAPGVDLSVPVPPMEAAAGADGSAAPRAVPATDADRAQAAGFRHVAASRAGRGEIPVPHVGERPPTYGPEPTALPEADPEWLGGLVPDTALEGAQYGAATLRAASVRGDSARYRGEPRRDALLTVRFGDGPDGLLLAVLAAPLREAEAGLGAAAATDAARQLAAAIGRSRAELSADLRAGARDRLRYGLQRIATQAAAPLRAPTGRPGAPVVHESGAASESASEGESAAAYGVPISGEARVTYEPDVEQGSLHCLLVSLDPAATHRAAFGTGPGGLYLLRSGHWIDAYAARLLHHPDGQPPLPNASAVASGPRPFRFRLVPATPGDILLLCTPGLADPIAEEPAVAHFLANHWAHPHPPGTVDFLRQVQVRAKGYADDRTAAALWTE